MTGDVTSGNHNLSLKLTIRLSSSSRFDIGSFSNDSPITPSSSIRHVKQIISQREESGNCPVERQRLIYKGRILSENERTLADYGISGSGSGSEGIVLYLVKGSGGSGSTVGSTAGSGSVPGSVPGSAPGIVPGVAGGAVPGTVPGAGPGASTPSTPFLNPFGNMMGGSGMDMASFQREMQNNPQMMQEMMNNPMVQSIMSNPDFMRTIMENNPQMRQVLDSNPELRHVLQDPELMRRSMQMMRDPAAMQNMMRNQDLAMSQIENMPGGYSALRRMYEDVQAPMMDAMTGTGDGQSTSTSTTSGASAGDGTAGASNRAMPNPWGSAPSTAPPSAGTPSQGTPSATNPFANPAANPWGSAMGMPNLNFGSAGGAANPWANPATGDNAANLEATIQMLENPIMNQMMQNMMANPEAMRQMMEANPMMRQLRQTNPGAAAIMSNPETMRAMMDPNNLRAMLQMQQAMQQLTGSLPGLAPMVPGGTPTGTTPQQPSPGGLDFSSLLGAGTSMPSMAPLAPTSQAPGQRFQNQLRSLQDMGFTDREANIRALTTGHGNVNRAIEILLENPPEMEAASATPAASTSEGDNSGSTAPGQSGEEQADAEPKGPTEKKND